MDTFRRRKIRPFQRVDITNNVIHSLRPPTQGHVTICEVVLQLLWIVAGVVYAANLLVGGRGAALY